MSSFARKIAKNQNPSVGPAQVQQLLSLLTGVAPEIQGLNDAIQGLNGLHEALAQVQEELQSIRKDQRRIEHILQSTINKEDLERLEAELDAQEGAQ